METVSRCLVLPSTYRDSVWLMHLSSSLEDLPQVQQVAVMMGASHNKALLQAAGLLTPEGAASGATDLLVCVRAATPAAAQAALQAAEERLAHQPQRSGELPDEMAPRSLDTALRRLPAANLACISVPGAYAAEEARKALQRGLHVFLFSAHVALEDEIALKQLAAQQGLLLMGPDCGTAILHGLPLGFANQLPRGPVGLIAASGTGLQQVSCLLAQQGLGVSQAIGVGGRDLHARVGGHSMRAALQALAQDAATRVLVLLAKPPAPAVAARLMQEAAATGKPCVVAFLGDTEARPPGGTVYPVSTLAEAARVAAALAGGRPVPRGEQDIPAHLSAAVQAAAASLHPEQRLLRALYCGGTLAHEALTLLRRTGAPVCSNLDETLMAGATASHLVLDLGGEEFTQGRPHPMIDPGVRRQHLVEAARDPAVAVVLCDVMLGWGAHADPAGALATAWAEALAVARAAGRHLLGLAHVCGAPDDPQDFAAQCARLRQQGFILADSNAQAVYLAAAALGTPVPVSPPALAATAPDRHAQPSLPPVSMPEQLAALLATGPRVINVGLEMFATQLAAQGVPVVQVDWRPPAGGDTRLASLLARLR
ncbi:MAG: acyl-CoA synthetase FdrA [Candidatus Tectimicrobiota bacterium]